MTSMLSGLMEIVNDIHHVLLTSSEAQDLCAG